MMIASAGNLSATQSIIHLLKEGFENPDTKAFEKLSDCPTMFEAAQMIGRAVRRVHDLDSLSYMNNQVSFDVSFLFGGQIGDDEMRLFLIYAAGNFIECSQDAPFFQIGEYKYGKPVLDRAVSFETQIEDALKIALISMWTIESIIPTAIFTICAIAGLRPCGRRIMLFPVLPMGKPARSSEMLASALKQD